MPTRKKVNVEKTNGDVYKLGFNEGYHKRDLETVDYDLTYWRWGEWLSYMIVNILVALGVVIIFVALTIYLHWATSQSDRTKYCTTTQGSTGSYTSCTGN